MDNTIYKKWFMRYPGEKKKTNYPIDVFSSIQQNKFDRWTDFNEVEVFIFKTRYL